MTPKRLPPPVEHWFSCWNTGTIDELPLTDNFRHTSPFGTIEPKARYMEIVRKNAASFLGNKLTLLKYLVDGDCVCAQFKQTREDDPDFEMIVCEWYFLEGGSNQGNRILLQYWECSDSELAVRTARLLHRPT